MLVPSAGWEIATYNCHNQPALYNNARPSANFVFWVSTWSFQWFKLMADETAWIKLHLSLESKEEWNLKLHVFLSLRILQFLVCSAGPSPNTTLVWQRWWWWWWWCSKVEFMSGAGFIDVSWSCSNFKMVVKAVIQGSRVGASWLLQMKVWRKVDVI